MRIPDDNLQKMVTQELRRSEETIRYCEQAIALTKGVADFGQGALKLTYNAQTGQVQISEIHISGKPTNRQSGFPPRNAPIAFVDPGAFLVRDPARSPRTRLRTIIGKADSPIGCCPGLLTTWRLITSYPRGSV